MDVFEALATRRTASAFSDRVPPREVLERVIEAATWAPNHHLTEPWRFVVIAGDERGRFADRVAAWMAEPDEGSPRTPAQIESMRKKLVRAPVIVAVIQRGSPDDPTLDLEDYPACACATQNLLLAARAEGLATKWSTGEMATLPPAREQLGLSPGDRIVAYVYLGYPATDEAKPAARRPAEVSWRGIEG
jgi:nitroreductase